MLHSFAYAGALLIAPAGAPAYSPAQAHWYPPTTHRHLSIRRHLIVNTTHHTHFHHCYWDCWRKRRGEKWWNIPISRRETRISASQRLEFSEELDGLSFHDFLHEIFQLILLFVCLFEDLNFWGARTGCCFGSWFLLGARLLVNEDLFISRFNFWKI